MGEIVKLTAADDHRLDAYRAGTLDAVGGIVIVQEIFGMNAHIRRVCDQYAQAGFLVVAPAYFDRIGPNLEASYSDFDTGRGYVSRLTDTQTMLDTEAGIAAVRGAGKVAVVGYCWGGFIADLASCRVELDAAVSFYGTRIQQYLNVQPRAPVLYHWGELDQGLPPEAVARIQAARPGGRHYIYPGAGHGFNCEDRPAGYNPEAAALAFTRTLKFLNEHLFRG